MKRPPLVQLQDAFFILAAIGAAFLSGHAIVTDLPGKQLWVPIIFGAVITLAYTAIIFFRGKLYRSIDYTTSHGIHVILNGYSVHQKALEDLTDYVLDQFDKVGKWSPARLGDALVDTIVIWKKCPCDAHARPGLLELLHPRSKIIRVGYHNPIKSSSLCHSLTHVLLSDLTELDIQEQEDFQQRNNLP